MKTGMLIIILSMLLGCVGRVSQVLVPEVTRLGSLLIDTNRAEIVLWRFESFAEVRIEIAKRDDPENRSPVFDSERARASVELINGKQHQGSFKHSPGVSNAGWITEATSFGFPVRSGDAIRRVIVAVDGKSMSFGEGEPK